MTDTGTRPRRVNGLQPPYTATQISTWIILPVLVLQFLFFVSPMLPLAASIICTIVFCGIAGAGTYFGYMAMKIDPSDPRLFLHGNSGDNGTSTGQGCSSHPNHEHRLIDPNEPTKQCWICDIQVAEKSMHCKFCNKCVDQFDHHCMWLNTCVGKANYPFFFRTMICITCLLVVHAAIQLALILDIYIGNGNTKQRSEEWFNMNSSTTTIIVVVMMGIFLLFDVGALTLIGQLLVFHLKLQRRGLSTYTFIVQDNQRRREQSRKQEELQVRRKAAIAKAEEDGNWWLETRLSNGGFLRDSCGLACCDPLSLDAKEGEEKDEAEAANGINGHTTSPLEEEEMDV